MDGARAQTGGDPLCAFRVTGLDEGREPVFGVVGDADGLGLVLGPQDAEHGAEDLLPGDGHVVGDIGKDGGAHVPAAVHARRFAGATGDKPRAFLDAGRDHGLHAVPLDLVEERPDMVALRPRIADLGGLGRVARDLDDLVVTGRLDDHPCGRVAGLSGVQETLGHGGAHAVLQRLAAIGEDQVGGLAAQLQRHALDRLRGGLGHRDPRTGRSGEGDHGKLRVPGHRVAHFRPGPVDQREGARRHARVMQDLCVDLRRERRVFGRLEDRRTAGRERGQDLERDLVDRPVPWCDHPGGTDRLAQERVAIGERPALFLRLKRFDEAVSMADPRLGLNLARHADRRAHLEAHGLGKVLSPRLRALPDTSQQREPLRLGPTSEFVEDRARRLHRVVHVLQTPERDPRRPARPWTGP